LIWLRLFETTAGDETSSTGRVVTGHHEVSCSQHLRPIGLPLRGCPETKSLKNKILRHISGKTKNGIIG
jgi:hypothetical protein